MPPPSTVTELNYEFLAEVDEVMQLAGLTGDAVRQSLVNTVKHVNATYFRELTGLTEDAGYSFEHAQRVFNSLRSAYTEMLAAATQESTATFQENRRRQQEYGGLVPRRQQQAAEERRAAREAAGEEAPFQIPWEQTNHWATPTKDYAIRANDALALEVMADSFLWQSIIWIIRNAVPLCKQMMAIPSTSQPALTAYVWLRGRPLLRALVKEAIKRNLTFPSDVFQFMQQYMLDNSSSLDGYQPWKDPQEANQMDALADFLDEPLVPPDQNFGRNLRAIDLE